MKIFIARLNVEGHDKEKKYVIIGNDIGDAIGIIDAHMAGEKFEYIEISECNVTKPSLICAGYNIGLNFKKRKEY